MSAQDHYAVLGVEPTATTAQIKKAFRAIARANHPDTNPKPEAAAVMARANQAHDVLTDTVRRAEYDETRRGIRRVSGTRPSRVAGWSPARTDEAARTLREGRPVGSTADIFGATYSIEWVTFGDGDEALERAALCCNGEVLESDSAPPTSHPAATPATHKRFAEAHEHLPFEFNAAQTKRGSSAALCSELRERWCDGDPNLGEGNSITIGASRYTVEVIPLGDDGRVGRRALMRNGACLENLPDNAMSTRFASNADLDQFDLEADVLRKAIETFLGLRDTMWRTAPSLRADLDDGDGVAVEGTTYSVEYVDWTVSGEQWSGMVLCADGHPVEKLPGRAVDKGMRGNDLHAMARFEEDAPRIREAFDALRTNRQQLLQTLAPIMHEAREVEELRFSGGTLHVVDLTWTTTGFKPVSGHTYTLCDGQVALNPHAGVITTEGYRRPTLDEAIAYSRQLNEIRATFDALRDARNKLVVELAPLMTDLREGDSIPFDGGVLHVADLGWATTTGQPISGSAWVLCHNDIALNPHWGIITTDGYRRPTYDESVKYTRKAGAIRSALASTLYARRTERIEQEKRARQEREQREAAERQARRDQRRDAVGGWLKGSLGVMRPPDPAEVRQPYPPATAVPPPPMVPDASPVPAPTQVPPPAGARPVDVKPAKPAVDSIPQRPVDRRPLPNRRTLGE